MCIALVIAVTVTTGGRYVEANKMSIDGQLDEQITVQIYNDMQHHLRKEGLSII